jgi:hypothetical protein
MSAIPIPISPPLILGKKKKKKQKHCMIPQIQTQLSLAVDYRP